ncbi:hypothetical protein AZH53_01225 [Methanomicrobiaceae archaeon CYW5]|uniref:hypothetical protein n=1 Tax=Methanovulcanius yangii TaxID=1789227 RepID=UPI0029CA35A7|nr:hypothetical protein [Methanovulcanius yangii]MBT8507050.1 hypothetical protein [Methanovulcanius yangii]
MNGRTLTRIIVAAAVIGIGMGLLLQLVLSFPACQGVLIPAAVILAALAAASQWDWVRDEIRLSDDRTTASATSDEEDNSGKQDRR